MGGSDDGSIGRRLERIESNVFQIKIILFVVLVILVVGVFGPEAVVQVIGGAVFVIVLGGCAIYASLLFMDVSLTRKMGTEEEREELMRKQILETVNIDDTNDKG